MSGVGLRIIWKIMLLNNLLSDGEGVGLKTDGILNFSDEYIFLTIIHNLQNTPHETVSWG